MDEPSIRYTGISFANEMAAHTFALQGRGVGGELRINLAAPKVDGFAANMAGQIVEAHQLAATILQQLAEQSHRAASALAGSSGE